MNDDRLEGEVGQCYRCREELSGRGFPVDLNTGPSRACLTCYKEGRRLGYFE